MIIIGFFLVIIRSLTSFLKMINYYLCVKKIIFLLFMYLKWLIKSDCEWLFVFVIVSTWIVWQGRNVQLSERT